MEKAIIFGVNGYLGRHIAYSLAQNSIPFLPTGISSVSIDNYQNYLQLDITDKTQFHKIDFNVDTIFVFAGLTGTNIGFDKYDDFIKVNEIGLLNILNHYIASKSKARIVFPSTRLVYKGVENKLLIENSQKETLTIYAQNKLACEGYLKMYQRSFNVDYTIFRICVPYGNLIDNNYSYGTLGFFLNNAKNGKNITLYGDGSQKRTFTHVQDVVNTIFEAVQLQSTKNNTYNVGSNDNLSLLEVAHLVAYKYKVGIDFLPWPASALKIESGDTIFDDHKLLSQINYNYLNSIANWINH